MPPAPQPADAREGAAPKPFVVTKGEWLVLVTRFSNDGVNLQCQLEREQAPLAVPMSVPTTGPAAVATPLQ